MRRLALSLAIIPLALLFSGCGGSSMSKDVSKYIGIDVTCYQNDPSMPLGGGAHATVYKCVKKSDDSVVGCYIKAGGVLADVSELYSIATETNCRG